MGCLAKTSCRFLDTGLRKFLRAFGACLVALLFGPRQGGGSHHWSPEIDIHERTPGDADSLLRLFKTELHAKKRDRFHAILLAFDGETAPAIARTLGRSRRTVQDWCYAYRDGGIEALTPRKQPGRPTKLKKADVQRFEQRLEAGPLDRDHTCTLRGSNIQTILKEEFDVDYSLGGVYQTLHRLGYSCLKPRPQHRKSDPEAQAKWVDRAPFLSGTSASCTPPSGSSFISRTSAGSGNKGG